MTDKNVVNVFSIDEEKLKSITGDEPGQEEEKEE